VCELFGVFHVQTVLTFSDTARNPLTTFMSGRFRVSEVRERLSKTQFRAETNVFWGLLQGESTLA
jgi:hypothetical protein